MSNHKKEVPVTSTVTNDDGKQVQRRRRRRRLPLPPLEMMQQCVATSMTQIIVNMNNAAHQQTCRELLQINNLEDAYEKIMQILRDIEKKKMEKQLKQQRRTERNNDRSKKE